MILAQKNQAKCSIDGCDLNRIARGWCRNHYNNWQRRGEPVRQKWIKHSLCNTPEWKAWKSMRERCSNANCSSYARYGGRGIQVCERWHDSFVNFYSDMGRRLSPQHSLDRINVDGNYEPSNCRWASRSQQQLNKRVTSSNGFRGIQQNSTTKRWQAWLSIDSKVWFFGYYATPQEAAHVRDQAAMQIHGSDAPLNFEYES